MIKIISRNGKILHIAQTDEEAAYFLKIYPGSRSDSHKEFHKNKITGRVEKC